MNEAQVLLYNGELYALQKLAKDTKNKTVKAVCEAGALEIRRLRAAAKYWESKCGPDN